MITLTEKAEKYIGSIIPQGQALRLSVQAGGCSGLGYKMEFIDISSIEKTDNEVEFDTFKIIIDPKSALTILGTEIDYSDGLSGSGFSFNNPLAERTCGCGKSFC